MLVASLFAALVAADRVVADGPDGERPAVQTASATPRRVAERAPRPAASRADIEGRALRGPVAEPPSTPTSVGSRPAAEREGAGDAADERPIVDLADHVPARWLDGRTDRLPLTPERWRRRVPRECRTRGGYRDHCQGARLVPTPYGAAAALARRLALGHRATGMLLMNERPLDEWIEAVEDADPDGSLLFPVEDGRIGRGFGRTRTGSVSHRLHRGVDIGAPEGTPIRAARGGLVVYADNGLTGYGNVVILLHREGYSTLYAHCRALRVFAGQRVERGGVIGEVGMTGFAPAPHLHFEWRQRGWPRNPVPQLRR